MGYNNYKREFEVDEEKAAELLENAVEKITTEEDIDTLAELIKIFRNTVPLSRRKYVTAYLLKDALKHYHSFGKNNRAGKRNEGRDFNRNEAKQTRAKYAAPETSEQTETPRHPRVEIAPDQATSIFISIGKNRRVYPRDLVGLLIAVAGLDRDRIGDIKVLANYSFVQLYTEDAQTAIDKLNEYEYRGRKLAVSYSRQKSEVEGDAEATAADTEAPADITAESETVSEEQMTAEDAAAYAAAEKAAADKEPFGNL